MLKLLEKGGKDMKKIKLLIEKRGDSHISISNSLGKEVLIDLKNGILNASNVFSLFDNGLDVLYECSALKIVESDKPLSKSDLMFNDCLDLIISIYQSINTKIEEANKKSIQITSAGEEDIKEQES